LPDPKLPLVLGHEIVGTVVERAPDADRFAIGDRVGVPWLGWTCGVCDYCRGGRENLCDRARFTGYQIDGGYAELTVADQRYCFAIDPHFADVAAAPLLCAGLIGYRTLRLAGDGERIGVYGFGAAPIGWKFNFRRNRRVQPFAQATGGFLYFNRQAPVDDSSRFNFTFDFSGGVQIVNSNRRSFTIGYKYQHISNGFTGNFNPGVDVQMIFAGFSVFK